MLCAPVLIFTSGSSALLGRPRCGLSIWLSLLAIFKTLFWVCANLLNEKTDKTLKYSEGRHFRMLRKWPPTVPGRAKHFKILRALKMISSFVSIPSPIQCNLSNSRGMVCTRFTQLNSTLNFCSDSLAKPQHSLLPSSGSQGTRGTVSYMQWTLPHNSLFCIDYSTQRLGKYRCLDPHRPPGKQTQVMPTFRISWIFGPNRVAGPVILGGGGRCVF